MKHPQWAHQRITALSLATTGIDPETSEICGYALMLLNSDSTIVATREYVVNTNHPVPDTAAKIHGLTTHIVNTAHPLPAHVTRHNKLSAAQHLANTLLSLNNPLVVFNAPWAFELIERHCDSQGVPFSAALMPQPLIDPLVLDRKNIEATKAGGRTLSALCSKRGLPIPDGRIASNAYSAGALTLDYVNRTPQFSSYSPVELGEHIGLWYTEAEEEYQTYMLSRGRTPRPYKRWMTLAPESVEHNLFTTLP